MDSAAPSDLTLEFAGQPLRLIPGIAVSSELFEVLGTPPFLGRTFTPGEDLVGAEPVAVLSYSLWEELGRDPSIVGRPLQLGGVARTVVGVMPQRFWFPSPTTRVWTAAQMNPNVSWSNGAEEVVEPELLQSGANAWRTLHHA